MPLCDPATARFAFSIGFHISMQALEEDGTGRVLVVDGGASMRCALLGDNIAEMGYKNGWSVSLPA